MASSTAAPTSAPVTDPVTLQGLNGEWRLIGSVGFDGTLDYAVSGTLRPQLHEVREIAWRSIDDVSGCTVAMWTFSWARTVGATRTADACGRRQIDVALAEEICVQRTCFERFHANLRAARTVAATDSTVLGPTA